MGPLLFSIFVRNIPTEVDCVQFADDITKSVADKDLAVIAQKLTTSFTKVKDYCKSNDLVVKTSRTQLLIFETPNKKIPDDFCPILDNCEIKPTNSAKLLGVKIDRHFTFA